MGAGRLPARGQEDFPVSGVSWYETAAYAEFAGKALPTIYHWVTAASPWIYLRVRWRPELAATAFRMPSLSVKETRHMRVVGTKEICHHSEEKANQLKSNARVPLHFRRKLDDNLAPLLSAAYH
jgi:sulfatase-modifying factor enzyme 1